MPENSATAFDLIRSLLQQGKEDNYPALVCQSADTLKQLQLKLRRIQRLAPDVALSPYINRALDLLAEAEAASINASISAAA